MNLQQEMFRLLHDAATVLLLEESGNLPRKQFDDWRQKWIEDMARLMMEMLQAQEKSKDPWGREA